MIAQRWLVRILLMLALVIATSQQASALWISIQFKSVPDGSWSLFGTTYLHSRTITCVKWGTGPLPADLQNSGIELPDGTSPNQLALTDVRYYAGPGALAATGGDPVIFDDTMFPAPAGYDFETLGGTEFNIHFNTPLTTIDGPSMLELPGVFVSSRLLLGDPNLVRLEARIANGSTFAVDSMSVPEPSTAALAAGALAAMLCLWRRRR